MSNVIPFVPKARHSAIPAPHVEPDLMAVSDACSDARAVLDAASMIIKTCRTRYGFAVMQSGLPPNADALAKSLVTLATSLKGLDKELAGTSPFWSFGVYLDGHELAWFDDGYGPDSALTIPVDTAPNELSAIIVERVRALRRRYSTA